MTGYNASLFTTSNNFIVRPSSRVRSSDVTSEWKNRRLSFSACSSEQHCPPSMRPLDTPPLRRREREGGCSATYAVAAPYALLARGLSISPSGSGHDYVDRADSWHSGLSRFL